LVTTAEMSHVVQPNFFENILVNEGSTVTDSRSQPTSQMLWRTAGTNSMTSGTPQTNADVLTISLGQFSPSYLALKKQHNKEKAL